MARGAEEVALSAVKFMFVEVIVSTSQEEVEWR